MYEKVFKTDFDKDPHAQKKMLNIAYVLSKWLKTYLVTSKALGDDALQQMIWLSILQERDLKDEFAKKATEFYTQIQSVPFKKTADALPVWVASYFHREHVSWEAPLKHAETIQHCTETMTACWDILRLKMACEMSMVQRITAESSTRKEVQAAELQMIGLYALKDIYETLWQLIDSGNDLYFTRLEAFLKQFGAYIDPGELNGIFQYAYYFTANQSRHKQEEVHYERTHRLNILALEHGVFLLDGYMPSSAFGNIVTIACLTKDYNWASRFIKDYNHVLQENQRDEAVLLAQAIVAFETNNYKGVIELLESVDFTNHLDMLRAKSLLLRSYYEFGAEQDVMLNTCASFENLLRRSSPQTEADKAMLAFVLTFRKIVTQKSGKELILNRIEKSTGIYSKKWLIEKMKHYKPEYAIRKVKSE
ncbi:hypothetical protein [Runella sp.]|uniref:hypothetical protein n=1 Tax=Runella sp. TaxID=1960881 RepID=UPI003019F973